MSAPKKVLCVLTSVDKFPDDTPTGFDLAEVAHAYSRWTKAGLLIEFASVTGTAAVDPATVELATTATDMVSLDFSRDEALMAACSAPKKLADVLADEEAPLTASYEAVYLAGGHGTVFDLPESEEVKTVIKSMFEAEKVVASCGEGSVGLVNVDLSDGSKLLADKECTGQTDEELAEGKKEAVEGAAGFAGTCEAAMGLAPEGYEGEFKYGGGVFTKVAAGEPHVACAGKLITGQNAASTDSLATTVLYLLDEVLAKFEPPRDALMADRAKLVEEINAAKDEFTVALNGLKTDEASNVGKIEELQMKAVAKRDWQFGRLATIDSKLERVANDRQKFADELAAAAAAAVEE